MTIVDLIDAEHATAGGKAAPLAKLARAGFPVPQAFVVPASAYRAAAAGLGLSELAAGHADEARSRILASRIPTELVAEIARALERITAGAPTDYVAVRSSSIAEDNSQASAAGQHDSVLAVRGPDQACEAIIQCWASLWTERAITYRARNATKGGAFDMAVLVQRFVDASASGIMFTGTTSVIEASWGIGERIVAGRVTPDSWRVTASGVIERRLGLKTERTDRREGRLVASPTIPTEQSGLCLTDSEVLRLHRLGTEVAATLGGRRDVEWAITAEEAWVLQARPVTVPVPEPISTLTGSALITGTPASPGIASGPVRLVLGPTDFPRVEPGDVIVCRHTDPAWTPLFTIAAAVVTETGGVLSHAAIVAREVGIPAVLAVPQATELLPASSTAIVNGDTGQISLSEP